MLATRGGTSPRRRTESGAAAVEFALVLVPFLVVVFGLIQYGFYFYAAQTGSHAADSAIRQLSVGNCQTQSQLQAFINNRLAGASNGTATVDTPTYFNPDGSQVTNAPAATNVPVGGTVKLRFTFQSFDLSLPFVPFVEDGTVTREVQARVEDTVEEACNA